ncbi:MAG: hypothetical protein LBF54_03140 [Holosporaceae bacterium]|nr:hypothetical protein [Holosporaceae bacterium]
MFGYSLQFPRALLRLLQADIGSNVGIEICGDVAVFFPEGIILSEEDKSSQKENVVTNMSTNLWKTFYNWIGAIKEGELDAQRDRFVLYTNHSVTENSLVKIFDKTTEATIDKTIAITCETLKDINENHILFSYKSFILDRNIDIFKRILPRFELVENHKADAVYSEIKIELEKMAINQKEIEWVLESLTGLMQTRIMELIANNQPAIVSKKYMLNKLRLLLRKIHTQELINFAVSKIPPMNKLVEKANQRPVFVQQLEKIQFDDAEIIEAVSDYYCADINRLEWIERELVDASDMEDFEGKLCSFHENKKKQIELTQRAMTEEDKGKLLLNECQSRQETIAGKWPPNRTIQGSYHVLADEKRLGWHPRWEQLLNKGTEGV